MFVQDFTSDFIVRVNNALISGQQSLTVPNSKFILSLVKKLTTLNYFDSFEIADRDISITLNPKVLNRLNLVSKPSQPIYASSKDYFNIKNGFGFVLLTTSQGIKTHIEAKKDNIGGKVILEAIKNY